MMAVSRGTAPWSIERRRHLASVFLPWRSAMMLSGCVPKLITANFQKTGMSKHPKGLVVHIAQAPQLSSIYNWFNNPDQRIKTNEGEKKVSASAHFGIGTDGTI